MSSSEEFEMEEVQVPQPAQNMPAEEIDPDRTASTLESLNHQNTADDDDDDQDEWEEVDASVQPTTSQQPQPGLQITLDNAAVKRPEKKDSKPRKAGPSPEERAARLASHKIHVIALVANAKHRNKLLNDELLHARMLSLVPMHCQLAFSSLTPSNVPDPIERSRLFDKALKRLLDWWRSSFDIDYNLKTLLTTPYAQTNDELNKKRKAKGTVDDNDQYEVIRSEKSLQKRALQMKGSRDMSAQLFTALCRALNVPARLVTSLQAVPYRLQSQPTNTVVSLDSDDSDTQPPTERFMTWKERQRSGFKGDDEAFIRGEAVSADRAPPQVKLSSHRRRKPKKGSKQDEFDVQSPPIFWTEVFSRPDGRWIVVDPIRSLIRTKARNMMDPQSAYKYNKMTYVVAFEEDGYGKDVTPRYAKQYGTRTVKQRPPSTKSKNGDWWESVAATFQRPYRLARDDVEDAELHQAQFSEPMPQSMQGFKDHPVYVLERHLKREEVVNPPREVGRFKGEVVYPRANVQLLKTSENWLRQGRIVVEGAQPLKRVKQRAVTIGRRRVQEAAAQAGEEEIMQGLYSRPQTELYRAPPVVGGKVPKNKFGNIDLYTPTMLPEGAAHLPQKGVGKIAKKLGVDYGEAVTGFEFRQRRANPVISGIVIDATYKETVMDAFEEWQSQQAEKEHEKMVRDVYKQWQKVVQGLRIRERLKEYRGNDQQPHEEVAGGAANPGTDATSHQNALPANELQGEIKKYQPGTYEQSLDTITKAQRALPRRNRLFEGREADSEADATDEGGIDQDMEEVGVDNANKNKDTLEIDVPAKVGHPVALDVLIEQQEQEKSASAQKVAHDADTTHVPESRLRMRPSRPKRARHSSSENTSSSRRITRSRVSHNSTREDRKRNDEAVRVALDISDEKEDDASDDVSDDEVAPIEISSDEE
ncbi:hypothetical protein E3P81_02336 [Wallemia ichthyophaga]|uniref:DNA repair protein rhp41 n=1 Tax=Wallemia ichthyophaga TaxID=245174 RepID=A0A4T0IXD7_WALIC|nr:hypothetical protein E3P97_02335 [Wallemia ichthyophaga]TIB06599.1 hypothetical protein E3P96_00305 [Wallemia ichthyophaga]TIB32005.1 hypothetical protein E3P85_02057 [Wallemia ichthyophaga]TIB35445.1 hypothetical protein E3P86_02683 [Wallemia ichthyophaga]TIB46253.1 hypothetical protein E3P82_02333 [Wallemia ichthyophaga]